MSAATYSAAGCNAEHQLSSPQQLHNHNHFDPQPSPIVSRDLAGQNDAAAEEKGEDSQDALENARSKMDQKAGVLNSNLADSQGMAKATEQRVGKKKRKRERISFAESKKL